jgi:hypothetical protein
VALEVRERGLNDDGHLVRLAARISAAAQPPFQASERKAYLGSCVAIVKAKGAGRVTITASAPGLAVGSIAVQGE